SHVGATSPRDGPSFLYSAGREIDHRDAAPAVRRSARRVRATVGDIKLGRIAAWVKSVRAYPRRDEVGLFKAVPVNQVDAVGVHVGDIKGRAVGRNADVLRHPPLGELQVTEHLMVDEIDLDQTAAAKFACKDRVAAVNREISVADTGAARCGNRLL